MRWSCCTRAATHARAARVAAQAADDAEASGLHLDAIAALVAEGRSNKQVAAALFLSEKRIEHNLPGIYAKLGVRSRVELAGPECDRRLKVRGKGSILPGTMPRSPVQLAGARSAALGALARSLEDVAERIVAGDVLDIDVPELHGLPEDGDVAVIIAAADRLIATVRRAHALEAAVHELFESMSSHLRLDYLSYEALYRVIDHTQATGGAIVLVGEGPPDVVASVEFELEGEELDAVTSAAFGSDCPTQLEPLGDTRPLVAIPFMGDSGPLGAVLLAGVLMDREMHRLLALLARALGFAVSNALAHAAAEVRAATDPLTGCKNRRAGLAELAQAARLAGHGGPSLGAMMIDLDHFKRINDRYGHQVGDEVLRAVGGALTDALRDGDVVMRYGGEEFLAAVTGADEPTMLAVAERVSNRIRALDVPDGDGGTVPLTTSVGIAVWAATDSTESLIGRADRALYTAKADGRDRVVLEPAPA